MPKRAACMSSFEDLFGFCVAKATPSYQNGGDALPHSIDWEKAKENLSSLLTADQLESLRHRLERHRLDRLFSEQVRVNSTRKR